MFLIELWLYCSRIVFNFKDLPWKLFSYVNLIYYLIYVNFDCVKFRDVEFHTSDMESSKFVLSVFPE